MTVSPKWYQQAQVLKYLWNDCLDSWKISKNFNLGWSSWCLSIWNWHHFCQWFSVIVGPWLESVISLSVYPINFLKGWIYSDPDLMIDCHLKIVIIRSKKQPPDLNPIQVCLCASGFSTLTHQPDAIPKGSLLQRASPSAAMLWGQTPMEMTALRPFSLLLSTNACHSRFVLLLSIHHNYKTKQWRHHWGCLGHSQAHQMPLWHPVSAGA